MDILAVLRQSAQPEPEAEPVTPMPDAAESPQKRPGHRPGKRAQCRRFRLPLSQERLRSGSMRLIRTPVDAGTCIRVLPVGSQEIEVGKRRFPPLLLPHDPKVTGKRGSDLILFFRRPEGRYYNLIIKTIRGKTGTDALLGGDRIAGQASACESEITSPQER
jgi:hypothetical protein